MVVNILLATLLALAIVFTVVLVRAARAKRELRPGSEAVALGAVTNFFDTLGIGSFATTTAWLKLRRLVPDNFIPATLNTGHALPTVVQALIFIQLVEVDPGLLLACISAAVLGATLGAPLVLRLPVHRVQVVVGIAMLIAAALYMLTNLQLMPSGGTALALPLPLAMFAVGLHLLLGMLMTFGIGLYAPSLISLSLLGLNPIAAFPIMMGACAFLMPVSGLRFARAPSIDLRVAIGLTLGGIPAVMLAAWVVKSLPLVPLRWLVVIVVLYTGVVLLHAARKRPRPAVDSQTPVTQDQ